MRFTACLPLTFLLLSGCTDLFVATVPVEGAFARDTVWVVATRDVLQACGPITERRSLYRDSLQALRNQWGAAAFDQDAPAKVQRQRIYQADSAMAVLEDVGSYIQDVRRRARLLVTVDPDLRLRLKLPPGLDTAYLVSPNRVGAISEPQPTDVRFTLVVRKQNWPRPVVSLVRSQLGDPCLPK